MTKDTYLKHFATGLLIPGCILLLILFGDNFAFDLSNDWPRYLWAALNVVLFPFAYVLFDGVYQEPEPEQKSGPPKIRLVVPWSKAAQTKKRRRQMRWLVLTFCWLFSIVLAPFGLHKIYIEGN